MKKISRRNFLKVTAAGAVGAATLSLTGCGGSKDNGTTAGSTATSGAESKGYNLAAVDSSKNTEVVLWHNPWRQGRRAAGADHDSQVQRDCG